MRVDKITTDLIGREARLIGWDLWGTILGVDDLFWWGRDTNGCYNTWIISGSWEIKDLPEPRKKPSERIREIIGGSDASTAEIIDAIVQYLDEREEKQE